MFLQEQLEQMAAELKGLDGLKAELVALQKRVSILEKDNEALKWKIINPTTDLPIQASSGQASTSTTGQVPGEVPNLNPQGQGTSLSVPSSFSSSSDHPGQGVGTPYKVEPICFVWCPETLPNVPILSVVPAVLIDNDIGLKAGPSTIPNQRHGGETVIQRSEEVKSSNHLGTGNTTITADTVGQCCPLVIKFEARSEDAPLPSNELLQHGAGENKPVCGQCGMTFSRNHDLTRHARIHSGQENHVCDQCGKVLTRKHDLLRHYRLHTGKKDYLCDECGKTFIRKCALARHKLSHASGPTQ